MTFEEPITFVHADKIPLGEREQWHSIQINPPIQVPDLMTFMNTMVKHPWTFVNQTPVDLQVTPRNSSLMSGRYRDIRLFMLFSDFNDYIAVRMKLG